MSRNRRAGKYAESAAWRTDETANLMIWVTSIGVNNASFGLYTGLAVSVLLPRVVPVSFRFPTQLGYEHFSKLNDRLGKVSLRCRTGGWREARLREFWLKFFRLAPP